VARLWMGTIVRYALDQAIAYTRMNHVKLQLSDTNVPRERIARTSNLFNLYQNGKLKPEKYGLNFLSTPLGTSVFPLVQATLAKPARYYTHLGRLIVVFAVGDALASSNFLSGNGMTFARISVEWGIAALDRHYTDTGFGSGLSL
jgi:hypothetical protein